MALTPLTRRQFLRTAALGTGAILAGRRLALSSPSGPPNILVILTDDQRADALGCAGNPVLKTPNMDRLAAAGTRFANAFATSPICAASRASVLTGLYERRHRYTFGTGPLDEGAVEASYPALLRQRGYRTGFVGKLGVDAGEGGTRAMFDDARHLEQPPYFRSVAGVQRHLTTVTADGAIDFIRTGRGRPFCLSVSFNAPHAVDADPEQFHWPQYCDGLYSEAGIVPPGRATDALFRSQPRFIRESLGRERWSWRFDEPDKYREMVRGYYRMITGVDTEMGRILAELETRGLAENTVVIFASDNGYFLGERGLAGKWLLHEPSVRIPLIVSDPRAPSGRGGRVAEGLAANVDIAPTVLELAGVQVPSLVQGLSLAGPVHGRGAAWREDLFMEHLYDHPQIPQSEGVRTGRHKYIRYLRPPGHPGYEELYDLERDPAEAHNLAGDRSHAGSVSQLRARCDELAAGYSKV